jgi:penicillin-binding protein 1A
MKKYSPQDVIRIARKMGITSDIPPVYSIALGSADLTLYEMTGAMSTFVNKGVYIEPIFIMRIEDRNGNLLETFIPKQQEAISEETAYMMIMLMKGVVESGTGVRLRYKYGFDNPIAGKTGTTQNQSDGWFMGLTPDLVSGIWVGCEDRAAHFRSIDLGQGANMALPIWAIYMKKVYADIQLGYTKRDFDEPSQKLKMEFDCDKYQVTVKKKKKDYIDDF